MNAFRNGGEASLQPLEHRDHQGVHRPVTVIAGDVGVQVLSQPLDSIVIRAVRREAVQLDLRAHLVQQLLDPRRLVDDIVVEDHVDHPRPRVRTPQRAEQVQE